MKEHSNENNLAVTQVDHYLLLRKCDVVEKVKLIVWKWAARAGLILNHYHHCSMADSSFGLQGVLPWCSLEQIDKLVLLLQEEECGIKRLKTHCTLCICPLSARGPAGECSLCLSELLWFIGIAVLTLHVDILLHFFNLLFNFYYFNQWKRCSFEFSPKLAFQSNTPDIFHPFSGSDIATITSSCQQTHSLSSAECSKKDEKYKDCFSPDVFSFNVSWKHQTVWATCWQHDAFGTEEEQNDICKEKCQS